jgi:hypothetical protein
VHITAIKTLQAKTFELKNKEDEQPKYTMVVKRGVCLLVFVVHYVTQENKQLAHDLY